MIKLAENSQVNTDTLTTSASYYLRSGVTGNVIREYDYSGALVKSNVFIGDQMIAQQSVSTGNTQMLWQHRNPVTGDSVSTDSVGHTMEIVRMDPTGVGMGDSDPFSTPQAGFGEVAGQDTSQPLMGSMVAAFFPIGGSAGCTVDGMLTGCALVNTILSAGAGVQCPENDCGNVRIDKYWASGRVTSEIGVLDANALEQGFGINGTGYVPVGYQFVGANASGPLYLHDGQTINGFDPNSGLITESQARRLTQDEAHMPWDRALNVSWAAGPQDPELLLYANKYYINHFDDCNGSSYGITKDQAALAITAGSLDPTRAAQVAAIWTREDGMAIRPGGDAGPAQLTTWWSRNHPELIVGNAYGSWKGRIPDNARFDGDPLDNLMTLSNIIGFSLNRYNGSFRKTAYNYGPPPASARESYASDAVHNYDYFKPFFDCLKQKGSK